MSEAYEYGEDRFNDEDEFDEDDEMRMAILEAEANEVWQEEPGDEEDETQPPVNPLFGLLFSGGIPDIPGKDPKGKRDNNENTEH
ncbi:MAG: hypothetical protein IJI14_04875 [Anaerolineaceae bacterium]|nr:hypothetical protein [Anaerolineaceae bacterium]